MTELLVIFVIGLLVLGPKRLPELARSLGKGIAEFRRASMDIRREFMDVAEDVRIRPPSLEETASDMPAQAGDVARVPERAEAGSEPDTASPESPGRPSADEGDEPGAQTEPRSGDPAPGKSDG